MMLNGAIAIGLLYHAIAKSDTMKYKDNLSKCLFNF